MTGGWTKRSAAAWKGAVAGCLVFMTGRALLGAAQVSDAFPNAVAAGEVTSHSVLLWALAIQPGPVVFAVSTHADFSDIQVQAEAQAADPVLPVTVEVRDLAPGTQYFYRATDALGRFATGRFRTAAQEGSFRGLRFGVSGDWRGELGPYLALANAPERDLDFFVALGDTIYADYPSPAVPAAQARSLAEFRAKHNEVYSARFGVNALGELRSSTAVFAVPNDHEVLNDYAGGAPASSDARFTDSLAPFVNETELYRTAMQAFQEYNPIRPTVYQSSAEPRVHLKPRFYRKQQFGSDATLFLLDTRSFRDEELPGVVHPLDSSAIERFHAASFEALSDSGDLKTRRTLLGQTQLSELKADLLRAQETGSLWKFVLLGEPIQNLGFMGGSDRFDGYARERAELFRFILDHRIRNVVFISADLHGTVVNNISYQSALNQPFIPTEMFEVVTGPVAYEQPLGPTAFDVAAQTRVLPGLTLLQGLLNYVQVRDRASFEALPRSERDRLFQSIMDVQLTAIGLDPIGLENSPVRATLQEGHYVAAHTYGWSEFAVDPHTQALTVTTYGLEPRQPPASEGPAAASLEVVSRFVVRPASSSPGSPELSVRRTDAAEVEIRWPVGPVFVLQSSPVPGPSAWSDAAEAATMAVGWHVVRVPIRGTGRMFRLRGE